MRREILCTAEPFGYGPSSSLAQIIARMTAVHDGSWAARYAGQAHTLDFHATLPEYEGRVTRCALDGPEGRAQFADACRAAEAVLTVCDFDAARIAGEAGTPFIIYDPLAWFWPTIPAACREAELYICQDFFGVRERIGAMPNAMVVPPLTPRVARVEDDAARAGILISLGGLGNPYFTRDECTDYAAAVLGALRVAIGATTQRVTSLTSKAIASALPALEVSTLPPDAVHERMASAALAFLTPGLGQIYEAAALGLPAVWLPPANDSQGRQLAFIRRHGMAPGALDWHEILDCAPVDYTGPQADTMKLLGVHMRRLLDDASARDSLARLARERMAIATSPARVLARFGEDGATVAATAVDRVLGSLRTVRVPRENRTGSPGAAVVGATIRGLADEVCARGFNTLCGALEIARAVGDRSGDRPTADDFATCARELPLGGVELVARWGSAHCTALAEVLRLRVQRATGLTGLVLGVRHRDSAVPLRLEWRGYEGVVHADLLVPFVDEDGGFHAVHVITGIGIGEHVHVFDSEAALLAHLRSLRYTLAPIRDASSYGGEAFAIRDRLWIVKGPTVGDDSEKLGIDLVDGVAFLNGAAAARSRGPRSARLDDPSALAAFAAAAAEQFAQPELARDFERLVVYLGRHVDLWCDGILREPGRGMRRARAADPLRAREVDLVARARRDLPPGADLARRALDAWTPVAPPAPAPGPRVWIDGLRFDLARNVWMTSSIERDPSWAWTLRLSQFLDWDVPPLFVARDALATRLADAAGIARSELRAFIDDLAHGTPVEPRDASTDRDAPESTGGRLSRSRELLDAPVPFVFGATDGGDRPRVVWWDLRPRLAAELLAAFELEREVIADRARRARAIAETERAERTRRLASVLANHRGSPVRHRRVHWAYVNLANAGQTLAELSSETGVLPASRVRLEPADLARRHATARHQKLRFVLDDRLAIHVLDDDAYWAVVARWGFPPNHELLSGARPILAAGYLTIDAGRIVAVEDDGTMLSGKLPRDLPPMVAVLEALGFALDRARLAGAMLVVDWAAFEQAARGTAAEPTARADLEACEHAARPERIARHIRSLANAPREYAIDRATELLAGFRVINVGGSAIASGDLPKGVDVIDRAVAAAFVRKVLR